MRLKENGQSVAILQQIGREIFDSNDSAAYSPTISTPAGGLNMKIC